MGTEALDRALPSRWRCLLRYGREEATEDSDVSCLQQLSKKEAALHLEVLRRSLEERLNKASNLRRELAKHRHIVEAAASGSSTSSKDLLEVQQLDLVGRACELLSDIPPR